MPPIASNSIANSEDHDLGLNFCQDLTVQKLKIITMTNDQIHILNTKYLVRLG